MNAIEAAELLAMLAATTGREPTAAEAQGWAWALDDVPIEVGRGALQATLKSPDAGYVTPQVIRKHAAPLLRRIAADVRSAKLRRLVPEDWPEARPLPEHAARALQAEWEATNDRDALGSSIAPKTPEIGA